MAAVQIIQQTRQKPKELHLLSVQKGRAAQMNYGASLAAEEILYFLHADTLPPKNFTHDIAKAIKHGYGAGCYMLSFDHNHWF